MFLRRSNVCLQLAAIKLHGTLASAADKHYLSKLWGQAAPQGTGIGDTRFPLTCPRGFGKWSSSVRAVTLNAFAALCDAMSGRKGSHSAIGAVGSTSTNRSLPVRSSVRTRTLDPFNKHDKWESLLTAGEQAEADSASGTSDSSPESPKRSSKGSKLRSKPKQGPSPCVPSTV